MTANLASRRTAQAGAAVLLALILSGCGSSAAGGTSTGPGTSTPAGGSTSLTVTAKASKDATAQTWTLTCDPAGGTHPDPQAACAALAAAEDPFKPVPKDVACTEIYGGAQTAVVTGTFRGQPVTSAFNRTNGCEIGRWDAIAAVLVVEGGV